MLKNILKYIFQLLFRVQVKGLENYAKAGEKVLIIANHVSFLDSVLLVLFLPDKLMFAINSHIAQRWYVKPLLYFIQAFPLDPTNSIATKSIIQEVKKGRKCMIFPEGRITMTGSLMKIYQGPALIAEKTGAKILPIYIDGAERSYFSRLHGKIKRSLFPKITLTILEPQDFAINEGLEGRERRHASVEKLYTIMSDMVFQSTNYKKTLFSALIEQNNLYGRRHIIMEDAQRKPVSYGALLTRAFALGACFSKETKRGEYVGMLLPNSTAAISTFFALQAVGRVPAMLNYSTGAHTMLSMCATAGIKTIYTAHAFIEAANLYPLINAMKNHGITICYLEDYSKKMNKLDQLKGIFYSFFPSYAYKKISVNSTTLAQKPAVVLFTSGSEGMPKGVVLSHENILANIAQTRARIDFNAKDILFNALPIFHSFGLTVGTLLPLLSGVRTFFYPSPLHYRIVPELIYDSSATIMFGTDTFLANYARYAHAYDFRSIRYIFAGAEKLKESTRELYAQKYGVRIFEGYGATETAPILSMNTAMHNKIGTVGRFMPSIQYILEPVEGINKGGKLLVTAPNVMLGYLLASSPCTLIPPKNNTYDTGDIVEIDEEGYVMIKGRVKRFAKIAGEMISLTAVEEFINSALQDSIFRDTISAVINVPDNKKGEALILYNTYAGANRETPQDSMRKTLLKHAQQLGITELYLPKEIKLVEKIPLLATGKVDYVTLQSL